MIKTTLTKLINQKWIWNQRIHVSRTHISVANSSLPQHLPSHAGLVDYQVFVVALKRLSVPGGVPSIGAAGLSPWQAEVALVAPHARLREHCGRLLYDGVGDACMHLNSDPLKGIDNLRVLFFIIEPRSLKFGMRM